MPDAPAQGKTLTVKDILSYLSSLVKDDQNWENTTVNFVAVRDITCGDIVALTSISMEACEEPVPTTIFVTTNLEEDTIPTHQLRVPRHSSF